MLICNLLVLTRGGCYSGLCKACSSRVMINSDVYYCFVYLGMYYFTFAHSYMSHFRRICHPNLSGKLLPFILFVEALVYSKREKLLTYLILDDQVRYCKCTVRWSSSALWRERCKQCGKFIVWTIFVGLLVDGEMI